MPAAPSTVVFLFTDIEGSTRLWEEQPQRMGPALAAHDALARAAVAAHRGTLIKTTGDGLHAAFDDALDGVAAALALQRGLADPQATGGLPLAVRCGLHAGADEARDNDYYGRDVNRAARIMSVAHGGQVLLSQAVAQAVAHRLPEGVALKDLGRVRLRDLSQPEQLHQLVAPPLRVDFPALRSLEATPNNLVQQVNRFIGRTEVLAELRGLLAQHRLVTLLGPGGIGKSRLSLQLAAELMDGEAHADGVWLVELAPLSAPAQVAQAVAAVLGVKEEPGQPLADALARCVRDRRLLIILDNCEHLLDAAAALARDLLRAGPGVRLLASSREALHTAGEQVYPVPALSVPASAAAADVATLLGHEAVRLFVDRAQAASPHWQLGPADAAAVAEICQRVDGIPLALELAAARARALPLPLLAQRLRDSFALLSTRDTTVPPRQRTLQLLIDWSHDLLGADERRLFARLSVFAGGCTLADAEAVCADEHLPADTVLDLLAALVDKSLLQPDLDRGRYQLLDTIRQYAAQRLAAVPDEAAAVQRRHIACRLAQAEALRPQLAGAQPAAALATLDAERGNLLAALDAAARDGGEAASAEAGLRLAVALRPYWLTRGLLTAGADAAEAALAHPLSAGLDGLRARVLFDLGHLCNFLGRFEQARGHLQACLDIVRAQGDVARVAAALQPLGTACAALGDHEEARACFESAVATARQLQQPRQLAAALTGLAHWHGQAGSPAEAEPLFAEALVLAQAQGDAEMVVTAQLNMAMVQIAQGHLAQAIGPVVDAAAALARRAGARALVLSVYDLACALAVALQDWPHAQRWLMAGEALCAEIGMRRQAADEAFLAPWRAQLATQLAAAGAAGAAAGLTPASPGNAAGPAEGDAGLWPLRAWLADMAPRLGA